MARARTRSQESKTEDKPEPEDNAVSDPPPSSPPSARAKSPSSLAQKPVDREPRITIAAFTRGLSDPIVQAFAHHERLGYQVRKRTRAEWQEALRAFKGEPRG